MDYDLILSASSICRLRPIYVYFNNWQNDLIFLCNSNLKLYRSIANCQCNFFLFLSWSCPFQYDKSWSKCINVFQSFTTTTLFTLVRIHTLPLKVIIFAMCVYTWLLKQIFVSLSFHLQANVAFPWLGVLLHKESNSS